VSVDLLLPFDRGDLVQMVHQHGMVEREEYTEGGTRIVARVPPRLAGLLEAAQR
jgi:GTP-binding protein HflX